MKKIVIVLYLFAPSLNAALSAPQHRLLNAVQNQDVSLVKQLLDKNNLNRVDCNFSDERGYSPLLSAVSVRNLEIIEELLQAGANPNAKNIFTHRTVLHEAAGYANLALLELLLAYGADTNIKNTNAFTPLGVAFEYLWVLALRADKEALKRQVLVIERLLDAGARPDQAGPTQNYVLDTILRNEEKISKDLEVEIFMNLLWHGMQIPESLREDSIIQKAQKRIIPLQQKKVLGLKATKDLASFPLSQQIAFKRLEPKQKQINQQKILKVQERQARQALQLQHDFENRSLQEELTRVTLMQQEQDEIEALNNRQALEKNAIDLQRMRAQQQAKLNAKKSIQ
jgi:hypothetical protein